MWSWSDNCTQHNSFQGLKRGDQRHYISVETKTRAPETVHLCGDEDTGTRDTTSLWRRREGHQRHYIPVGTKTRAPETRHYISVGTKTRAPETLHLCGDEGTGTRDTTLHLCGDEDTGTRDTTLHLCGDEEARRPIATSDKQELEVFSAGICQQLGSH